MVIFWNILILAVGCFACTCAGAVLFGKTLGADFLRKKFDRVETLCVEFLAGSGVLGTVWLILGLLPEGWFGQFAVIVVCGVAVMMGSKIAWRDIKPAWSHIRIIVTQPQREMNISVKILHWLILAGLAGMLIASLPQPEDYSSVGSFLVAKEAAYRNTLSAGPGVESFAGGGLLVEMNIASLMLFGATTAASLLGFVYMLVGLMLTSGVGSRAGLNYASRWILVLLLASWVWFAMSRQAGFAAMESCGMTLAALIMISCCSRENKQSHILAGCMVGWALMAQCVQAAVVIPSVVAFAFSAFSRQKEGCDGKKILPLVMRRLGWLFAPLAVLFVLWIVKNLVIYHAVIPTGQADVFTREGIIPLATLPLILIFIICLKVVSEKGFRVFRFNLEKPASYLLLLLAGVLVIFVLSEIMSSVVNAARGDIRLLDAPAEVRFAKYLNTKADPEKEKIFIVSPYRYFLDNRLIASSSDKNLLRQLGEMNDIDKWRRLWDMGYRYVYLTPENSAFDGNEAFVMTVVLGDNGKFTLNSACMPPELGVEMLCLSKTSKQQSTHGVYRIIVRENAIIPDNLAPIGE